MRFIAGILCVLLASEALAAPCTGVDRSLSPERKAALSSAIGKQMNAADVEILSSFRTDRWTLLNVDAHQGDEAFLFYSGDPSSTRYIALWAGAARLDEGEEIRQWALSNAPGIPPALASCFAWYVTIGRGTK